MLTGAWGEVMRGFVYGATVKATCTQNPKFFLDLFEKAWKGDTFKITFDSLFNRNTSKWVGGFHDRDHYVIAWRNDLRPDYLVHEVTHHGYPNKNESWVKRTAQAWYDDCYEPPPPPPSAGGGGGNPANNTFGYWLWVPPTFQTTCIGLGACAGPKQPGSPDGTDHYECPTGPNTDTCFTKITRAGYWVWVEGTY